MEKRVKFIYERLLAQPSLRGVDLVAEHFSVFQKTERTFWADWKKAQDELIAYNEKDIKKTNKYFSEDNMNKIKEGKKTKDDWISIIQRELEENRVEESVLDLKSGKVTRYYRTMTPTERRGYIERIAKFDGLDSPNKFAQTDTEGNDIISQKDIQELHAIVDLLNGKK